MRVPSEAVEIEAIQLEPDLTYEERPIKSKGEGCNTFGVNSHAFGPNHEHLQGFIKVHVHLFGLNHICTKENMKNPKC